MILTAPVGMVRVSSPNRRTGFVEQQDLPTYKVGPLKVAEVSVAQKNRVAPGRTQRLYCSGGRNAENVITRRTVISAFDDVMPELFNGIQADDFVEVVAYNPFPGPDSANLFNAVSVRKLSPEEVASIEQQMLAAQAHRVQVLR